MDLQTFIEDIILVRSELTPIKESLDSLLTPDVLGQITPLLESIDDDTTLKNDVLELLKSTDRETLERGFTSFRAKYPAIEVIIPLMQNNTEAMKLLEQGIDLVIEANAQPTEDTQPNLLEQITQTLESNASWIEQTRLSLVVNGELYKKFLVIEQSYNTSLKVLVEFEQSTKATRDEVLKVFSEFESKSQILRDEISQILQENKTLSAQCADNANTILQALASMQEVKDDVHNKVIELYALRDNITTLQSQLQDFEQIRTHINDLHTKITALKNDLEAKIELWVGQINSLTTTSKVELEGLCEDLKGILNTHKDTLESEMTTHKTQALRELESKIAQANERYTALETSFIDKQNNIDAANAELTLGRAELEKQLAQAQANISSSKQLALSDISGALEVSKKSLESERDTHITTLESKTQEHTNTLNTHKDTLEQTLSEEMKNIKDSYLAEIRNDIPAQVADLTQLVNEIKASNQALGTNFVSQTYTTSQSFTPIVDVKDYYVFVRGGTGGSNSSTRGGTTSFGSLLTATGGAGNPNGAGQVGESRAGFVSFSDKQVMSIASGGIVIVSYATK